MNLQNLKQGSPEWLDLRKKHIGASEAPIIMQQSPFDTPYSLWRQKLDLDPPKIETPAMTRGKEFEPIIRNRLEEIMQVGFIPAVLISRTIPFMMASLDAISEDGKTVIEIKCPNINDHMHAINKQIPEKYIAQLQHQMYVCELDEMHYASYYVDMMGDLVFVKVYRDDKFIKGMIDAETKFYECMQDLFTPPDLISRDYIERRDDEWYKASSEWRDIYDQKKELEKKEEEARKRLIALAQDRNCKGNGVSVSKVVRKGNIPYADIPEVKQMDLESHRKKPIESWRIS